MAYKRIQLRCDRVQDKEEFKAVVFAVRMIRKGTPAGIANSRAAKYYGVNTTNVARYVGQHASRTKNRGGRSDR